MKHAIYKGFSIRWDDEYPGGVFVADYTRIEVFVRGQFGLDDLQAAVDGLQALLDETDRLFDELDECEIERLVAEADAED